MKQEVIDLSQSDSEDEIEKKTKVEEVKAETQAKSQDQEAETEAKARVSISDQETVKKYRLMLEQSPDYLDTINEDLLPRLANTVSMIKGKALEWQDQVTVVYLGDPDSDLLLAQVQLQLLKSKFFFTDKGETKWVEVMVVADPVHCQLQVLSRMMGAPEHDLAVESRVALPRNPTAEAWNNVCVLVEEAFVEIFSDIYCEEEEEEELKTPVKKAKPATLVKDTDDDDDSDDDDDDDDDEPMPPVQANGQDKKEETQVKKEKPKGKVPAELESSIRAILEKGLFRRNDYGYFLMSLRSVFNDDKAWEDMLVDNRDPKFDLNNALCERRRLWARVTSGKSPATDQELLEMVRQYNVAAVQLQAQRLDCIEELKTMKPKIRELSKADNYFNWGRFWSNLANSIVNLDNLHVCISLGIYPLDYTWGDVREVLEDRMLADGQVLPPLDSTLVYDAKQELELLKQAWEPIEARIKASDFARNIL